MGMWFVPRTLHVQRTCHFLPKLAQQSIRRPLHVTHHDACPPVTYTKQIYRNRYIVMGFMRPAVPKQGQAGALGPLPFENAVTGVFDMGTHRFTRGLGVLFFNRLYNRKMFALHQIQAPLRLGK